jgi:hypothetical protein
MVDPAIVGLPLGISAMDLSTPALEALAHSGLAFEVVRTRPARNAEESAELQGIPVGSLLRTIVIRRGFRHHYGDP